MSSIPDHDSGEWGMDPMAAAYSQFLANERALLHREIGIDPKFVPVGTLADAFHRTGGGTASSRASRVLAAASRQPVDEVARALSILAVIGLALGNHDELDEVALAAVRHTVEIAMEKLGPVRDDLNEAHAAAGDQRREHSPIK